MNFRHIEVFLAVASSGSFSRAAEEVLLTQSTISQHVAALEAELGVQLFDRTGRGAKLTEGGELFREHAWRVMAACGEMQRAVAQYRGLEDQRLLIGASNIPGNYLLPGALARFAEAVPGVVVNVFAGDSRESLTRLKAREVAVAVVGDCMDETDLAFDPLLRDALHLVVGSGHPWRLQTQISLEELAAAPLIVREEGSGSGRATLETLRRAGLDTGTIRPVACLGSNEAVKQAVIAGMGVAFLSSLSIRRELLAGDLVAVNLPAVRVERQLWLATCRERTLSPAAEAFVRILRRYCRETFSPCDEPPGDPRPDRPA